MLIERRQGKTDNQCADFLEFVHATLVQPYSITGLVIQLDPLNPTISEISWSKYNKERLQPSAQTLSSFSSSIVTTNFLDKAFDSFIGCDRMSTYLRIKGPSSEPTPAHMDLTHFRASIASTRGIPCDTPFCCFCGASMESCRNVPTCQRCGGGAMKTAWVGVTKGDSPIQASLLVFGGTPVTFAPGDMIIFDGAEIHHAPRPTNSYAPIRVSVDARAFFDVLPQMPHPSESPEQEKNWLMIASTLIRQDHKLAVREAENTRWLLEILGAYDIIHSNSKLSKAKSWRTSSGRLTLKDHYPMSTVNVEDTGSLVHAWMQCRRNKDVIILLKKAFDVFPENAPFGLTKRCGNVLKADIRLALHATHLIFLLTDWIAAPWRWADEDMHGIVKKDRAKVLDYCKHALNIIRQNGKQKNNAEIYLELAGCVGVLVPGQYSHNVLAKAKDLAMSSEELWEKIVLKEQKRNASTRYPNDVHLHCNILRAWVCRIRPMT
jgi:hypothetical protein